MDVPGPDQKLQPSTFGGHTKLPDPLFSTNVYLSRCLPIVEKSSIIVAVCGPNDDRDNAGPHNDGWFFSDFYLMHHLFRDTASTQYWLTCISPTDYVEKYTELLHGNSDSVRRVVLDDTMLNETEDIITVADKDLPERFLSYVADAGKQTKDSDRQILVMMFGNGWEDVYSVVIGCSGLQGINVEDAISPKKLQEALKRYNGNPQATVLSSSCYGGGWCFARSGNTSNIHGVNDEEELLSWSESKSPARRFAGSGFATSIAETLVRMQLIREEENNLMATPTFATLAATIQGILLWENSAACGNMPPHPSFAAQNDLWESEDRSKSGFPTADFKEKYEMLKIASQSASQSNPFDPMRVVSETLEGNETIKMNPFLRLPVQEAIPRIRSLAQLYLSTTFQDDNRVPKNHHVHNLSGAIISGKQMSLYDLESLAGELQYRMFSIIGQANKYKSAMGTQVKDFPWCHKVNTREMERLIWSEGDKARHTQILKTVNAKRDLLFDSPTCCHVYNRGTRYLALILNSTTWETERIEQILEELSLIKGDSSAIHDTIEEMRLDKHDAIRVLLGGIAQSSKRKYVSDDGQQSSPTKILNVRNITPLKISPSMRRHYSYKGGVLVAPALLSPFLVEESSRTSIEHHQSPLKSTRKDNDDSFRPTAPEKQE